MTNLKASATPFESACSEANNEICLAADGNLVRFSARETDFFVRLSVAELQDETALDSLLEKTLSIIDQFPTEQTPGPNTGYVGITFRLAGNVQNLWFTQTQANDLRVKGLKGASLYRALKITP